VTARGAIVAALAGAALLAAPPALAAKGGLPPGERLDLNRATVAELMRLPGVGERKAQAIVALRQKQPFRRVEDVLAVKGLGPAWLAKVKGSLAVGAPAGPGPIAAKK
jgi:competence protein ComEA